MNKTLLRSVREYKKQSILAPILVILEVLMEVLDSNGNSETTSSILE